MVVITLSPTFPTVPGTTAWTVTVAVLFHLTSVSGEVWANSRLSFLSLRRWPRGKTRPGELQSGLGQCGCERPFVYTTCAMAGARGTFFTPVVLKPCESVRETWLTRTWIGALPGSAWISMSRCEKGAACAMRVTDALGTNTAMAES